MMQLIGYPALVFMGIFPLLRRKHYELFKYFHYMFLVLVPAAVVHAHNGWYFPIGGLMFWLVDAAIKLVAGASPRELRDLKAHAAEGGITELRFDLSSQEPGGYCFINVPQISQFQWHPFSISSSPCDGCATMHIKNMGDCQWTGHLHALAKAHAGKGTKGISLSVDGPYGPGLELSNH